MALENVKQQTPPQGRNLARVLKELQGLKVAVLAGAAAATPIPLAGVGVDDTLLAVLEVQPPTAVLGNTILGDRVATTSIPSAGNIQVVASTAGNQLVVLWYDKQGL